MEWKVKIKKSKPKIGDVKEKIKFAFLPIKVNDNIVWLEKYIQGYEYKEIIITRDVPVSSGLIEDAFTVTGLINERYQTEYNHVKSWTKTYKKRILKKSNTLNSNN